MATVTTAQPSRYPITQLVPHSLRTQQAIFWSGVFLTTLALANFLWGKSNAERTSGQRIADPVLAIILYSIYFGMRQTWRKPTENLNTTPLMGVPISSLDRQFSNHAVLKILCGILAVSILLPIFVAGVDHRSFLISYPKLAMLPLLFAVFLWCSQKPRLCIHSTGLLWELSNSKIYFPWHLIESVNLIPGETLDCIEWIAPSGWEKSYRYETKIEKMTDVDREKLKQLLSQYTSVKPE